MTSTTKKAASIDLSDVNQPSRSVAAAPVKPQAALSMVGAGLSFDQGLRDENSRLKEQLAQAEGARGAVRLDPSLIRASRWADRHESSFKDSEFADLKREIQDAGGNVQPVKVRPLVDEPGRYELVFGHRRHRACLELGLPVLAVVQETDDRTLFVEMQRENRGRKNLSAWEQGMAYQRAMEAGLYASNRQLAAAIGVDHSDVSKALRIAKLPAEVVAAFASPNQIQFRWVADLEAALERDRAGVLHRALDGETMWQQVGKPGFVPSTPKQVFEWLVQKPSVGPSHGKERTVDLGLGRTVTIKPDAKGGAQITVPPGAINWVKLETLLKQAAL